MSWLPLRLLVLTCRLPLQSTAMDTLCAQAFGAGNNRMVGDVLQRGIIILGLACIPIVIVWTLAEPLLLFAGQDPVVCSLTGAYVLRLIPGKCRLR